MRNYWLTIISLSINWFFAKIAASCHVTIIDPVGTIKDAKP